MSQFYSRQTRPAIDRFYTASRKRKIQLSVIFRPLRVPLVGLAQISTQKVSRCAPSPNVCVDRLRAFILPHQDIHVFICHSRNHHLHLACRIAIKMSPIGPRGEYFSQRLGHQAWGEAGSSLPQQRALVPSQLSFRSDVAEHKGAAGPVHFHHRRGIGALDRLLLYVMVILSSGTTPSGEVNHGSVCSPPFLLAARFLVSISDISRTSRRVSGPVSRSLRDSSG